MSVSLKRIAEMAGVSPSTVSRVVNGTAKVSGATRSAILDAAAELGVEPVQLKKGRRVLNIALVSRKESFISTTFMSNYFYAGVLRGMEDAANDQKCNLLMASTTDEDLAEGRFPTPIRTGSVDGILVAGYMPGESIASLRTTGLPLVCVDTRGPEGIPCVVTDNMGGARTIVKHLIDQVGANIAVLSGPLGDPSFAERVVGYRCAMAERGYAYDETKIHTLIWPSMQCGYDVGPQVLADSPRGIFCTNDEIALGLLRYLTEQGVRMPDQIAIAGFDDIRMASHVHPTLTTVHTHREYMGAVGLTKLVNIIKGHIKEPEITMVTTNLIVRTSTVA